MFNSILLPIDLSDEATWVKALPAALRMATLEGAALHIATVVPDFGMSIVGSYFEAGFEKKALHDVGEKLTVWINDNIPDDTEVHPHVLHGRVYEQIIKAAQNLNAGVIVMGSHRPELSDYLLGPNASRVVRHATQSVFIVRGE